MRNLFLSLSLPKSSFIIFFLFDVRVNVHPYRPLGRLLAILLCRSLITQNLTHKQSTRSQVFIIEWLCRWKCAHYKHLSLSSRIFYIFFSYQCWTLHQFKTNQNRVYRAHQILSLMPCKSSFFMAVNEYLK